MVGCQCNGEGPPSGMVINRAQCQWHLFTAAVVTFSGGAADDRASGAIGTEDHRFFDASFPLGWSETPRVTMPP